MHILLEHPSNKPQAANAANHAGDPDFDASAVAASVLATRSVSDEMAAALSGSDSNHQGEPTKRQAPSQDEINSILAANAENHNGDADFNADAVALGVQSDEAHLATRQDTSQSDLDAIIAANIANHTGDADVASEDATLQAASDAAHA